MIDVDIVRKVYVVLEYKTQRRASSYEWIYKDYWFCSSFYHWKNNPWLEILIWNSYMKISEFRVIN